MSWLKKIFGKVGSGIKTGGKFLLRYGPVLASFGIGLGAVPQLAAYTKWIPVLLGLTGVSPDPTVSDASGELIVELVLLVGSIRKFISIAKKNFPVIKTKLSGD